MVGQRCWNGRRRILPRADPDAGRLRPDSAHDSLHRLPPEEAAAEAAKHEPRAASVRSATSVRHFVASVDVAPVRHPFPAAAGHTLHSPPSALHRRRR